MLPAPRRAGAGERGRRPCFPLVSNFSSGLIWLFGFGERLNCQAPSTVPTVQSRAVPLGYDAPDPRRSIAMKLRIALPTVVLVVCIAAVPAEARISKNAKAQK